MLGWLSITVLSCLSRWRRVLKAIWVAWLSRACQGVRLHDDDTLEEIAIIDGHLPPTSEQCDTCITLSEDVVWKSSGSVFVHGFPDSLAFAALGRSLSTVVSHPVLDRHALNVIGATPGSPMASTKLTVELRTRMLTPDDLYAMSPGGVR